LGFLRSVDGKFTLNLPLFKARWALIDAGFITCEVIESIHAQDKVVIASDLDGVGVNDKNLTKKIWRMKGMEYEK
jgi:hypothetical protein